MNLIKIYKCLCDLTRLRILNLLKEGPLCVCYIQGIIRENQVRISKQLAYMKANGLVESQREGSWSIYKLTKLHHPVLIQNLKCLQDCVAEHPCFREDLLKLSELFKNIASNNINCPTSINIGTSLTYNHCENE